jgi:alkylation response protein AidB-like acyl-CoA dehydrogenase
VKQDQLLRWLASNPPPSPASDPAERFAQLRAWQAMLNGGGWLGMGWPEVFGGRPGTLVDQAMVYATLAAAGAPPPIGIIGLQTVGPALLAYGSSEQKARYLPRILSADDIWCQGFSEPGAGSDLANVRTTAEARGRGFVLRGQKVWTSWAQYADLCAVLARTGSADEGNRGLSYLVVDMRAPGVTVVPITQMTGEQEFNELFLDDVVTATDSLVGEVGAGWSVALSTLENERAMYAISRSAELRLSFDRFLSGFEPSPDSAADFGWAEITLAVMAALSRAAARDLSGQAIGTRSAVYKLLTSQLEQQFAARQLGMAAAEPASLVTSASGRASRSSARHDYLMSRAATIHGGTAEILRGVIAQRLLGLPRDR